MIFMLSSVAEGHLAIATGEQALIRHCHAMCVEGGGRGGGSSDTRTASLRRRSFRLVQGSASWRQVDGDARDWHFPCKRTAPRVAA
jgi:hypothetical protein